MTKGTPSADFGRFIRSWFSAPLRVGAISPSGEALARLMTREIMPSLAPILELGPGTGVFTRALLTRGIQERDLTLVEYGRDFTRLLQRRFPQARVLQMDAALLEGKNLFRRGEVAAVISGLPLLSMPTDKVTYILSGAFAYLRPGGAFYQFTYGPKCPIPSIVLDRLGLRAIRVGSTIRNLPPATVYRIVRADAA